MRIITAAFLVVLPLTAVLSCEQDREGRVEGREAPAMVEPSNAGGTATALLTVGFEYAQGTFVYAEGARHFLQVSDNDGTVVLRRDEGTDQGSGGGYTDSARLQSGRYTVETYQRECDFTEGGDCTSTIGPLEDRCATSVLIRRGRNERGHNDEAAQSLFGPMKPAAASAQAVSCRIREASSRTAQCFAALLSRMRSMCIWL